MEVGLLVLRIVVGAFFIGHGCQKLFGWFGGHGLPWEYNVVLIAAAVGVVSALAIAAAARVTAADTGPARPAGA
jgi:uncharacterized membrane protein YphA (DoxX/SURF4 family)